MSNNRIALVTVALSLLGTAACTRHHRVDAATLARRAEMRGARVMYVAATEPGAAGGGEIESVEIVRRGRGFGQGVLIGLLIGAGSGGVFAAVGAAADGSDSESNSDAWGAIELGPAEMGAVLAVVATAAGLVIGGTLGVAHGARDVYTLEPTLGFTGPRASHLAPGLRVRF